MPGETVQIELPEGMSKEEYLKLFGTFQKQRVSTAVRDKAVRQAQKDLQTKYKSEFEALVAKYMPKKQPEK